MHRPLLVTLVMLCALDAWGSDNVRDKVLGFTADGEFLAYLPPPEVESGGDDGDVLIGSAQTAVVHNLRTGTEERYLLRLELGDSQTLSREEAKKQPDLAEQLKEQRKQRRELAAKYKALPGKAAWQAWLSAHPVRCAPGKRSPDGKVAVDVKLQGKEASGSWGKGGYRFAGDPEREMAAEGATTTVLLQLILDGKPLLSDTWSVSAGVGSGLSGDVRTCWSPDSRWLAWLLHQAPPMMREFAKNELRLEQLTRPRIQLVAHKDLRPQAEARVLPLLEKAGYRVATSKDASQAEPRPATVLYATPAYAATAKAMVAAIPGGATVAPMDWKAAFDIVVAVGQSALAKP